MNADSGCSHSIKISTRSRPWTKAAYPAIVPTVSAMAFTYWIAESRLPAAVCTRAGRTRLSIQRRFSTAMVGSAATAWR